MKKKFSSENFIYFTIAAIPLYLIRISFSNFLEIMIIIDLAVWIWQKKYQKMRLKDFISRYKIFCAAIILVLAGLFLSTVANGNYAVGLGIIKGWFVLPLLFLLIAATSLPSEKYANAFKALYFSAFLVAIAALIFLLLGRVTYDFRLEAIYNSPNYLAMYLAPALIMGVLFFRENKFYYGASLAIIFTAFYFTFSYGAWLAAAIAILLVVATNKKYNKKYGKKIAIGLIFFGISLFLLSQMHSNKFESLASLNSRSSLASRIMIWESAEKMLADHWLWGIGPGNFQAEYLAYQKYFPPYLEWAVPHPHNLYLAFWLYSGITGLAGFFLLIWFWISNFFKKEKSVLRLASFGIIFYFLLHGLVDTTYFKNDLAIVFWLAMLPLFENKEENHRI